MLVCACSTIDGLKNDLSKGYDAVATTFAKVIDPEIEAKKKLPVFDGNCPSVSVRPDLARISDFYNPAITTENTKTSEATITGVSNTCRIENHKIIMQIDLTVSGKTGPKARIKPTDKPNFSYPYFIAVTDSKGNVLSKEIFATSLSYDSKQNETKTNETVFQNMPIPDTGAGEIYNVVVGFQLTPEQLTYNNKNFPSAIENSITNMPNSVR